MNLYYRKNKWKFALNLPFRYVGKLLLFYICKKCQTKSSLSYLIMQSTFFGFYDWDGNMGGNISNLVMLFPEYCNSVFAPKMLMKPIVIFMTSFYDTCRLFFFSFFLPHLWIQLLSTSSYFVWLGLGLCYQSPDVLNNSIPVLDLCIKQLICECIWRSRFKLLNSYHLLWILREKSNHVQIQSLTSKSYMHIWLVYCCYISSVYDIPRATAFTCDSKSWYHEYL